jgi:hypothetical protein
MHREVFCAGEPRRRSRSRTSNMWKSRLILILSTRNGIPYATPQDSRMSLKGQILSRVLDSLSVTFPNKVYAKCHGIIFTSIAGSHSTQPLLLHGLHDRCFIWMIGRQRRYRRPMGRFCQRIVGSRIPTRGGVNRQFKIYKHNTSEIQLEPQGGLNF